MFNVTKALLAVVVILTFLLIVTAVWVFTPPHSGVALSTGLVLLPFVGIFIAWIYDNPSYI